MYIRYGKRLFDISLSIIAALPALFLCLACALAIRAEGGGAAIFKQVRVGRSRRPFTLYKLRTMSIDTGDRASHEVSKAQITRVGRFLRKTKLDELPQLLNVIAGQMSLIGPRPALVSHLDRYTPAQRGRLRMKPGVTGLGQVTGRKSLPWSVRIELDNSYIDNYRPGLDAQILARTVYQVLTRSGVALDRNPETADDLAR